MKMYNYFIEFKKCRTNELDRRDEGTRNSWQTDKSVAEQNLQKDLKWCNSNDGGWVYVSDSGIIEKDINPIIKAEGRFHTNGEYEKVDVMIGKRSMYDLCGKYGGNKVRLTLEILP